MYTSVPHSLKASDSKGSPIFGTYIGNRTPPTSWPCSWGSGDNMLKNDFIPPSSVSILSVYWALRLSRFVCHPSHQLVQLENSHLHPLEMAIHLDWVQPQLPLAVVPVVVSAQGLDTPGHVAYLSNAVSCIPIHLNCCLHWGTCWICWPHRCARWRCWCFTCGRIRTLIDKFLSVTHDPISISLATCCIVNSSMPSNTSWATTCLAMLLHPRYWGTCLWKIITHANGNTLAIWRIWVVKL